MARTRAREYQVLSTHVLRGNGGGSTEKVPARRSASHVGTVLENTQFQVIEEA